LKEQLGKAGVTPETFGSLTVQPKKKGKYCAAIMENIGGYVDFQYFVVFLQILCENKL